MTLFLARFQENRLKTERKRTSKTLQAVGRYPAGKYSCGVTGKAVAQGRHTRQGRHSARYMAAFVPTLWG